MREQIIITNIQRMCFHDGPGIRTTVFLKGCSLHCPWCSNPENINFEIETYQKDRINGIYGKKYNVEELVDLLLKDRNYWNDNGGVTFSGGEALMQATALQIVLKRLKALGIHIAVETALFVGRNKLQKVLPYIDYFIVDIKILNSMICRHVLGGELSLYRSNIELLYKSGKLKQFRFPCCLEYTFTDENKRLLERFLNNYPEIPVQIFGIHSLGEEKYKSLSRIMWKAQKIEKEELIAYCEKLNLNKIRAEFIEI